MWGSSSDSHPSGYDLGPKPGDQGSHGPGGGSGRDGRSGRDDRHGGDRPEMIAMEMISMEETVMEMIAMEMIAMEETAPEMIMRTATGDPAPTVTGTATGIDTALTATETTTRNATTALVVIVGAAVVGAPDTVAVVAATAAAMMSTGATENMDANTSTGATGAVVVVVVVVVMVVEDGSRLTDLQRLDLPLKERLKHVELDRFLPCTQTKPTVSTVSLFCFPPGAAVVVCCVNETACSL
ncbi:uncharacterized protein LOC127139149 isoform X1 [Lates calcarifer]|uniref:Uncharacterized protein LOC127139149 isoform X1 n=1 Tax=Lates calcarifer TaxID=8187 RepID=A0AAJ8DKE6_LATCA|nr:uncharacterized protein LOC127139149 isoform X1 [Lates calcarifer]